jgi:hypothetical protein
MKAGIEICERRKHLKGSGGGGLLDNKISICKWIWLGNLYLAQRLV